MARTCARQSVWLVRTSFSDMGIKVMVVRIVRVEEDGEEEESDMVVEETLDVFCGRGGSVTM
jgi:hypothetical protein